MDKVHYVIWPKNFNTHGHLCSYINSLHYSKRILLQISIPPGIHLSLRGVVHANNSVIPIYEIGTDRANPSREALQCITDLRPCCRQEYTTGLASQMLMGEWYFPNKSRVHGAEATDSPFFRTRGLNDGRVNLFRSNTRIMSPVGSYCCQIPDIAGVNQTLCAVTGDYTICPERNFIYIMPFLPSLCRLLCPDQWWWNCRTELHSRVYYLWGWKYQLYC